MSNLTRDLFPACACFGPVMLALGSVLPNRDGTPYGLIVTIPGALMTTAALLTIFRSIRSLETKTAERSTNRHRATK